MSDLASAKSICTEFGISYSTLRRRIADGTITAYRLGPRLIRVSRAEAAAALRQIPTAA